jgi:hypothetical protein
MDPEAIVLVFLPHRIIVTGFSAARALGFAVAHKHGKNLAGENGRRVCDVDIITERAA